MIGPALADPGDLDTSFGNSGIALIDYNLTADNARAMVIQSDGKIVVAGYTFDSSGKRDWALARLNSNGTLDTSFGSGGKVVTVLSTGSDSANSVAIQSDGKIVAAGFAEDSTGTWDWALARYNSDGTLDTSFGSSGVVITALSNGSDGAAAVLIQSDGKIVAAGSVREAANSDDFALVRYNSNGTLDTSFGSGGKSIRPLA